jgi:hypothetical protein
VIVDMQSAMMHHRLQHDLMVQRWALWYEGESDDDHSDEAEDAIME